MNCAVLLCGCGHIDGSEIREAVLALLELDRLGVSAVCFGLDKEQVDVVDHSLGKTVDETRRIVVESSRIARERVLGIENINPHDFDMLVIPGGLGVAKNYSNILSSDSEVKVETSVKDLIVGFYRNKKVIGSICISPAIVAASLSDISKIKVTLGEDENNLISRCGGIHVRCETDDFVFDEEMGVFSCSAYMRSDRLYRVHAGIKNMIEAMVCFVSKNKV